MLNLLRLNMSENMLKFVKIGQQTPPKREVGIEKKTLTKFIRNLLTIKQVNNLAGVLNVEFLFARSIVH